MKGMFIKSVIVISLLATACSNKKSEQESYNLSDLFIETHEYEGTIKPVLWHADRKCTNIVNKDLPFQPGDAYLEQLDNDLQYMERHGYLPGSWGFHVSGYIPKYCNVCMQGSKSKVIGDPMQDQKQNKSGV